MKLNVYTCIIFACAMCAIAFAVRFAGENAVAVIASISSLVLAFTNPVLGTTEGPQKDAKNDPHGLP